MESKRSTKSVASWHWSWRLLPHPKFSLSKNLLLIEKYKRHSSKNTKFGAENPTLWEKFRGKIKIFSTRDLLYWTFAAFCQETVTSSSCAVRTTLPMHERQIVQADTIAGPSVRPENHKCKKTFFFTFLTFFILLNVFYFKKSCIENPIKSFVKHFWDYRNELIGHSHVAYLVSPNILKKTFLN